jgi:hypothetical protein
MMNIKLRLMWALCLSVLVSWIFFYFADASLGFTYIIFVITWILLNQLFKDLK